MYTYFFIGIFISFVATFLILNFTGAGRETFSVVGYNDTITYVNVNDDATGRAHIQDSIMINDDVKYKKAFYYEYDNKTYEKKLKQIFIKDNNPCFNENDWYTYGNTPANAPGNTGDAALLEKQPDILLAYDNCINEFKNELNNTTDMTGTAIMLLPDKNKVPIQVVHDVLLRYRKNKKPQLKHTYSFDIELILYRQSKYQGKHIGTRVIYDNDKNSLNVANIAILGVVSEDSIGMFPVVANNPFDIQQLTTDSTTYPQIIPSADYSLVSDKTGSSFWKATGYDKATIDTLKKRAALSITDIAVTNSVHS
uniref:Uncharacterized protein n=1 Tax=viral metagenome TaxID=1070528 RepID=A0A6C0KSX8_9ZZZZ